MIFNQIKERCENIEAAWQKLNFDSSEFYKVAEEHTHDLDLTELGSTLTQLELLDITEVRKNVYNSTFSDNHIQIYDSGRFYVEILNWWNMDVNVHDHDFTGVQFQLKGESLDIEYAFDTLDTFAGLSTGKLRVKNSTRWLKGSYNIIKHGNQAIHSVGHLSFPSVSLIIRTHPTGRFGVQSNYFSNTCGNYNLKNTSYHKAIKCLSLLSFEDGRSFEKALLSTIRKYSLSEQFFMLLKLSDILFTSKFNHILYEYSQISDTHESMVKSLSWHQKNQVIKKIAKSNSLCEDERLLLFALGYSVDLSSFYLIIEKNLNKDRAKESPFELFRSTLEKINESDATSLKGLVTSLLE